jgi:hypothetical protein
MRITPTTGSGSSQRTFLSKATRANRSLTTEANAIVAPIHPKAMPVILTTTEEFDLWLEGETVEALELQRPLLDGMARGGGEGRGSGVLGRCFEIMRSGFRSGSPELGIIASTLRKLKAIDLNRGAAKPRCEGLA